MKPHSVQIELVEGCNKLCTFCGLTALRSKAGAPFHFMSRDAVETVGSQIRDFCPTARIEFAMHGEPTLHPDFHASIGTLRSLTPSAQFQLTTNGRVWMKDFEVSALRAFDAGIDIIVLDTYEPERARLQAMAQAVTRFQVLDYYTDCLPKGISPWHNQHRKFSGVLIVMDDIEVRNGESRARVIMNHAGNASDQPVPTEPYRRTCTLPFREVAICFNGNVNICCMDWGHEYVCGNVLTQPLADIWNGAAFTAARRILQQKDRGFSPCDRCNATSGSRSGLLPKLPAPTAVDLGAVRAAHGHPQRNHLKRRIRDSVVRLCEDD